MLQRKEIPAYEQIVESLAGVQAERDNNIALMGIGGDTGATTVATNLARTISLARQNVLLIHILPEGSGESFGRGSLDFSEILTSLRPDESGLTSIEIPAAFLQRSDFVKGGPFEETLKKIRQVYSVILWDLPPADRAVQSFMIAKHAQGVILIAHAGKTRWQAAQALIDHLKFGGCRIYGLILNKQKMYIPGWIYRLFFYYS